MSWQLMEDVQDKPHSLISTVPVRQPVYFIAKHGWVSFLRLGTNYGMDKTTGHLRLLNLFIFLSYIDACRRIPRVMRANYCM
jgi:hypothetical protein